MVPEVTGVCCALSFLMNDSGLTDTSIKYFVREHLGCNCPDEVFEQIAVIDKADISDQFDTVYNIGGRLLVAVCTPSDWHEIENRIEQLVTAGMRFRDRYGYNRFRLVIATDETDALTRLQKAFESCPKPDEKAHMHVIKPQALPTDAPAEPS